jgi:hypothetical protein
MEMTSLEMPPSKLSELVGDRSDFTTEEIIQIASQLADGESIDCGVKITPIILLSVHLDNKNPTRATATSLRVMNPKHMRRALSFDIRRQGLHSTPSFVGDRLQAIDSFSLKWEDLVNIFDLGDSVVWHIHGHGTSNASMAGRHEQRWW